jgi:chromosome segregation ATPase
MDPRIAKLEAQLQALEQLAPIIVSVQDQADGLAATQRRSEVRLAKAAKDAELVQSQMERLTQTVDTAVSLKEDLTRVAERADALQQQRDAIDGAIEKAMNLDTIVQQTEVAVQQEQEHASALDDLKDAAEALQSLHAEVLERSAEIRSHQLQIDAQEQTTLEELTAIRGAVRKGVERADGTCREFDGLSQRADELRGAVTDLEAHLGALDESRESLTEVQAEAATLAMQLRTIADDCSGLGALETRVADLQLLHTDVLTRSERIAAQQQELDAKAQAALEELARIREGEQQSLNRLDVANHGFDSLNRRMGDLDDALGDCEIRFRSLEASRESISDVEAKAEDLTGRLGTIADECRDLNQQADRIRAVREDVEQLDEAVRDVAQQAGQIEEVRSEVDAVSRDLAELNRTGDSISDALEQARAAHTEITCMREAQAETVSSMSKMHEAIDTLQHELEEVKGMKPMVASVREDAERVQAAMTAIEARRQLLEEVDKRLAELEALGARLDDGDKGVPSGRENDQNDKLGWYFNIDGSFDWSMWEFGLQIRCAGRWKRGAALWLGPVRLFIGWERRHGRTAQAERAVEQSEQHA